MIYLLFALMVIVAAEAASDENKWIAFKARHQKVYNFNKEESLRFNTFKENLRKIEEHNKKADEGFYSHRWGINKFADLTPTEFESLMTLAKEQMPIVEKRIMHIDIDGDVPETFDWREKGAVTKVKNQGACRSCWAFSATEAVEGAVFLNTSKLDSLSPQNLIDCVSDCHGCSGGYMTNAFKYIIKYGIATESNYPYNGTDNVCKNNMSSYRIESYGNIPSGSESHLCKLLISIGPISAAIDATLMLQFYNEGVLNDFLCGNKESDLNHGVLLVGYGVSKGQEKTEDQEYWIVKNSWGTDWGMDGYFYLAKNQNNMCGIATMASYPIM